MLYDSIVGYRQKGYELYFNVDSKTLKMLKVGLVKKSRNKNHSNYFNIKFMP